MHASAMPRIRLARAAKLPLCRRETKSIGPAPAISKRAMATKAKPRAFHLFSVVASNARSRLKFP
jgi:hypothetical protein